MIQTDLAPETPVVYQTQLEAGLTWVTGRFVGFVTAGHTGPNEYAVVEPADRRALAEDHRRGAVLARLIYAVPEALLLGELDPYHALGPLTATPPHPDREAHVHAILAALETIAENYVVAL